MSNQVLSRPVRCSDGVTYPEGTPLDRLPDENRESVSMSGWTRIRRATPDIRPVLEPGEPNGSPDPERESSNAPGASSDTVPAPGTGGSPEPDSGDSRTTEDNTPAIADLALEQKFADLLTKDETAKFPDGRSIRTVADAREFRQLNGSFRVIKGIAKAGDEAINKAIDAIK
ncbi:hypothetical protein [Aureliella helgolandensis]|uniref:Uncharacterized protein n=1 Tax=Aureliella helgolandensis TaxID=2527968 RepID=A0A518G4B1_9BACT|nr:hypothetical protein [Aureliella helgolandensis]QDV23436.1 hypothetical protein Q31a_17340 [Aureliella helgolandensis]